MEETIKKMVSDFTGVEPAAVFGVGAGVPEEEKEIGPFSKDRYKHLVQIVRDYGYPIEKHFYTTKDHYINCVFRICGPRGTTAE